MNKIKKVAQDLHDSGRTSEDASTSLIIPNQPTKWNGYFPREDISINEQSDDTNEDDERSPVSRRRSES